MKFIVDTALHRRFEVEANSEEEARDIIEVTDDLETLDVIDGFFEIQDIYQTEE